MLSPVNQGRQPGGTAERVRQRSVTPRSPLRGVDENDPSGMERQPRKSSRIPTPVYQHHRSPAATCTAPSISPSSPRDFRSPGSSPEVETPIDSRRSDDVRTTSGQEEEKKGVAMGSGHWWAHLRDKAPNVSPPPHSVPSLENQLKLDLEWSSTDNDVISSSPTGNTPTKSRDKEFKMESPKSNGKGDDNGGDDGRNENKHAERDFSRRPQRVCHNRVKQQSHYIGLLII